MSDEVVSFLKELMRRHKRLPSQLSNDLGLCHPTVARWLAGIYVPNTRSCQKLAETMLPIERYSLGTLPVTLLGELIAGRRPTQALKSAFGTFLDFIAGTLFKIIIILVMGGFFIASLF